MYKINQLEEHLSDSASCDLTTDGGDLLVFLKLERTVSTKDFN